MHSNIDRIVTILMFTMAASLGINAQEQQSPGASYFPGLPMQRYVGIPLSTLYAPEFNIPRAARHEFLLGLDDFNRNHLSDASEHFRNACDLYPKYSSAYSALGLTMMKIGDFDASDKALERALELDPNNLNTKRNLAHLMLARRQIEKAEAQLLQVLAKAPHDSKTNLLLAAIELEKNDFNESLRHSMAVPEQIAVQMPAVYMLRGRAMEGLGRPIEAAGMYHQYLKKISNGLDATVAKESILRLEAEWPNTKTARK